jgi:ribosome-associated toxin RatA of RatAB toxin-antitoxin module
VGQKVRESTSIDAPPDVVWNVITDLDRYPEWAEGVRTTEVLEANDDGSPHRARFVIDAKVSEITYVIQYAYDNYDITWNLLEGDLISQLDGVYKLYETDEGGTEVEYGLEVDVDLPLPGFMKKRAARTILEQGLKGLKGQAESQA